MTRCCDKWRTVPLEATSVTVAGGIMTITAVPLQTYYDYGYYSLALCLALPAHTGTEPVALSDGSGAYPLFDTNGQPVVTGKLRGHRRLRIRYGAGGAYAGGSMPPHFTVYEGLHCMEYSATPALQTPIVEV